jgi:hypothetical protein
MEGLGRDPLPAGDPGGAAPDRAEGGGGRAPFRAGPALGGDRRRDATLFTPGLESGWLCFEAGPEKRRLTPIPSGWQEAPDDALEGLLERARRVPRRLLEPDEPRE